MWIHNLNGSAIIVQNSSGKFLIFDWNDCFGQIEATAKLYLHEDCFGYFNSQPSELLGHLETYIPHLEFKYKAFYDRYKNHYEKDFDTLEKEIYFNGEITPLRTSNNTFLANQTYKNHPEFVILQKTSFDKYLEDIFKYRLIYSPAGGGDFAHRDFETFALGIPVIRQKYKSANTTLQAGVHYVDIDTVSNFTELLEDKELLCKIGSSGRLWYEQNCLYPGNVANMKQLIIQRLI